MTTTIEGSSKPGDSLLVDPHESGMRPLRTRRVVLLVDDEVLLLTAVATALRSVGFEVIAIEEPLAALDLVSTTPDAFGALVTDFVMPSMSGAELARAVRVIDPRIGIILHSSRHPDPSAEMSFDSCIFKTGNLRPLVDALSKLVSPAQIAG